MLEALVEANQGHALAYGDDPWTKRCETLFNEVFGQAVTTLIAVNGTGANVLALAGLLNQAEAVLCSDWSHINVDETGAPERVLGAKLIPLTSVAGRVDVDAVTEACGALGNPHHAQPGVLSLTQSTEWGTCYSVDEIGALVERNIATFSDQKRVVTSFRKIGPLLPHFRGSLDVEVVTIESEPLGVTHQALRADAEKSVVNLPIISVNVMRIVRHDHR